MLCLLLHTLILFDMATEVKDPSWLRKNDWFSSYQLGPTITVSHDKKYMITKRVDGVSLSKIVGPPGSPGLTDGVQAIYFDVNNGAIPYGKTWTNARASGDYEFDQPVEQLASKIYNGNKHPALVFSQMMEDSSLHGSNEPNLHTRFSKVEQIFKRVAEKLRDNDGVAFADNELVCDYFSGIFGWETNVKLDIIGLAAAVKGMSTSDEAKKTNQTDQGVFVYSNYYANNVNYRGRIVPGYIEGLGTQRGGRGAYSAVYNLERNYIAQPATKCICYASGMVEGLIFGAADRSGVWQNYPVPDANGDLIRISSVEGSYDMLKTQTLLNLLIGDRYVIWDDNGLYGTNDKAFGLAYYGGPAPWKTKWKPNGGSATQYNPGAPGHPISEPTGQFATNHSPHNNGSWAGNYLYGQIWNYSNGSLKWPTFNYVENGVSKSGYYNGDVPTAGPLGTEVSRRGKSNPGQDNIARQWYNGRKPIVFEGTGSDPSKKCWIVLNLSAGFNGTTVFNIAGGTQITHVGTGIGVYRN